MEQHVKASNFKSQSTTCRKCKGKYAGLDQKSRQASVLSAYGSIANDCVCDNKGNDRCPYAE